MHLATAETNDVRYDYGAGRIAGSADLLADRSQEGTLPGSLATGRSPALGVNSLTYPASPNLASLVAQAHWNEGKLNSDSTFLIDI